VITYDIMPFFLLLLFPMLITAHKKRIFFGLYGKIKIFFQDQVFNHRVTFKHLHKRLWPFTDVNLHKRGVQSPSDDGWGACLPYLGLLDYEFINSKNKKSCLKLVMYVKANTRCLQCYCGQCHWLKCEHDLDDKVQSWKFYLNFKLISNDKITQNSMSFTP
jgi:hypothetical protein